MLQLPPDITEEELLNIYNSRSSYSVGAEYDNKTLVSYCAYVAGYVGGGPGNPVQTLAQGLFKLNGPERKIVLKNFAQVCRDMGINIPLMDFSTWAEQWRLSKEADFVRSVNALRREPSVVFIAETPHYVILREAIALRRKGWKVYLIHLQKMPFIIKELFELHFDNIVFAPNWRLPKLIQMLRPRIFHVQCWQARYIAAMPVIINAKKVPVICEFYDVTSLYATRDVYYNFAHGLGSNWTPKVADLDLAIEKYVLQHAGGVVTRFPADIADEWMDIHKVAKIPHAEIQAFALPEFTFYSDEKLSAQDGVLRMAYAGQLLNDTSLNARRMSIEAGGADACADLLSQGMAITALSMSVKPVSGPYHDLTQQYSRFQIRSAVSIADLSKEIAQHDFGLMLSKFDVRELRVRDTLMRGAVGTKLFSYLEAGLPVIVNAEYTEMSRIVTENGLGLAVRSEDIGSLSQMISAFDYQSAVANIRRFNEEQGMDVNISRLLDLYERALDRAGCWSQ